MTWEYTGGYGCYMDVLGTILEGIIPIEKGSTMAAPTFGEFSISVTAKPVGGITEGEIPESLASALAAEVPKVLASADKELTLTAASETDAKKLVLYARAWGMRQDPKLRITKVPNRRDMASNIARLSVVKDDEVPTENRPGRKTSSAK